MYLLSIKMNKRKRNMDTSFQPIDNFTNYIEYLKRENHKPEKKFNHSRNSPFRDLALESGRTSPFDENGDYILKK